MTKLAFVCTLLVAWCPREVGAFGFVPDSLARKLQQSALDEKIAVTPASEKGACANRDCKSFRGHTKCVESGGVITHALLALRAHSHVLQGGSPGLGT